MSAARRLLIGIDVGGTFTDAVVLDAVSGVLIEAFKIASSPSDPAQAVINAVDAIATRHAVAQASVCHGTTVGTNTLIERKGARTALLATHGFTDVIELRRQARPALYGFDVLISEPLVPAPLRVGIAERVASDGAVVTPLANAQAAVDTLRDAGVEAVAISFLNSYAASAHEEAMEAAVRAALPGAFVSRSSDVCPEFREYERTSTTVVNAYIGPAVQRYIARLGDALASRGVSRLMVVKSNGGLTSPENAARYPVHLIESGPAAAIIATAAYGRARGAKNLIAFDMGGTTAKAGVVRNGAPIMTAEFYADRLVEGRDLGGYAIRSAVLDLVEVGAGGGSIAWLDDAGVLKVGPVSAGADPGPACYGRGGERPTVTDAHAVIGTLVPALFEASGVALNRERAVAAIAKHIAAPLGWPLVRAAYAIIDIVVANMAQMVRLATVQRGLDPRDFAMLASGGAGPLHAAAVGEEIGARDVIVPPYPGMFSALGATLGAVRHEVTATLLRPLVEVTTDDLETAFARLQERVEGLLAAEPPDTKREPAERILEARFVGQMFELAVPLGAGGAPFPTIAEIEAQFRRLYAAEYGFDLPNARVQAVNLRLVVRQAPGLRGEDILRAATRKKPASAQRTTPLLLRDGREIAAPLYDAAHAHDGVIVGPAIIAHSGATVWIHDGHRATIGADGSVTVALRRGAA